jgi:hypothetical protein
VLRIFGPQRDEVTGDWRQLHNEEFHKLVLFVKHHQNDQVKEDEMGRAYSSHGEKRNACRILVGKPEGKRPLGRLKLRWDDNIKMDLRQLG